MVYRLAWRWLLMVFTGVAVMAVDEAACIDANTLVGKALAHVRGLASISTVEMTIHRPEWQRTVRIQAWTRGQQDSLFFIAAPAKDRGNGTLKKGREMWVYNPKVNRVIKLPPSMMSQSWMGSDFSNNDLARSDTLVSDYTHRITATEMDAGKKVYVIESLPKEEAPVVWGKLRLKIREDLIFLEEAFFDEDFELVKTLTAHDIKTMAGRLFATTIRMTAAEDEKHHTTVVYQQLEFVERLPKSRFTLAALKNPKR